MIIKKKKLTIKKAIVSDKAILKLIKSAHPEGGLSARKIAIRLKTDRVVLIMQKLKILLDKYENLKTSWVENKKKTDHPAQELYYMWKVD